MSDYYETHAADYADNELEPAWHEQRSQFAAKLAQGCRILDLGCGPGHDSHWFIKNGFDVISTDASSAMASEAKQRFDIDVAVRRIEDFADQDEYDAIWASASIHHIKRELIPAAIAAVANALKPGGLFYSSYKIRDEDTIDTLQRYYAKMDEADLRAMLEAAGFAIESVTIIHSMASDGKPANFVCAVARKSA